MSYIQDAVARIARHLKAQEADAGMMSALRRAASGSAVDLQTIAALTRALPDFDERRLQQGWPAVVAMLALSKGEGHEPTVPLGQALARNGFSRLRLERLLATDADVLPEAVLRVARFLSAKSARADHGQLAQLLLYRDANKASWIRQRIAMDFVKSEV